MNLRLGLSAGVAATEVEGLVVQLELVATTSPDMSAIVSI